jgi:hypothetical protein
MPSAASVLLGSNWTCGAAAPRFSSKRPLEVVLMTTISPSKTFVPGQTQGEGPEWTVYDDGPLV